MLSAKEIRRRLEAQGFTGLTDQEIAEAGPWLKFTPVLNTILIAVGTFLGSKQILLALAFLMALGSVLSAHPFDWLYNHTLRFWTRTRTLPPSGPRRRFVFSLECWWLLLTAWLFAGRHFMAAFILGCILTAISLLLAMANLCAISELLNWMSGKTGKRAA